MNIQQFQSAVDTVDRPMQQSKKFIGYLVAQVSWKLLLFYAVWQDLDSSVLLAMVTAAGAGESLFLGSQAWHDRYVKAEKIKAVAEASKSGGLAGI